MPIALNLPAPLRAAGRQLSFHASFGCLRLYLTVFALFLCALLAAPVLANGATIYWSPWVTNLSTTSATVNWRGADTATGTVDYATTAYYQANGTFQGTVTAPIGATFQHVPITGLDPNTSYTYRVTPSDNPDPFRSIGTFRTMPTSGPFTFIVVSDTHANENRFHYVGDAIAANETDALFILDGGDYADYDKDTLWTSFFNYSDATLAKFPIFHTIGNHEYHNFADPSGSPTNAGEYHSTYDVAPGGALNYAFDCSNIRFVVLNSPDPTNSNEDDPQTSLALADSQKDWLEARLNNAMAGTFTIHHHPIWGGNATMNAHLQPWETLYQTYKISASFAGHVHNYQRHSVGGIPYFVVGNGGGHFSDMDALNASTNVYLQYRQTRQLGYLKVTVDPANNTATAQEIFVASIPTNTSQTGTPYNPPIVVDTITFPLRQQAPTPSFYASFATDGLYRNNGSWTRMTATPPQSMVESGATLFPYFAGDGLYMYTGTGSSPTFLTAPQPQAIVASTNGFYAYFPSDGLYIYNGAWAKISSSQPQMMVTSGSVLYAYFPSDGLYRYDGTWTLLTTTPPQMMTASTLGIFASFASGGLYQYSGGTWTQITATQPQAMVTSGTVLYASFPGDGLYQYNGAWTLLTKTQPASMAASSTGLYASFAGDGLYIFNGSWTKITVSEPSSMMVAGSTLFPYFPSDGLYQYNGAWTLLTKTQPASMVGPGAN